MAEKKKAPDAGQAEVQAKSDEATAKGYEGTVPDKTPNQAYTIQGVTGGAKTPETDAKAAAASKDGE